MQEIPSANEFSGFSTDRPEQFGISARRRGESGRSVFNIDDCCERRSQQRRKPKCEGYMFPVAILAGGLATRLRPLTETIPKALIEINGEPFIAHQLRLLRKNSIKRVVLCIGYLGEMIQDVVGSGDKFGIEVLYSFDGAKLLGTAGAVRKALPLLGDNFFVMYGDSYLPINFAAVQQSYLKQQKLALMTIFYNQGQWDTSNVEYSNGLIIAYDKLHLTEAMHYIDYGLGVFNKEVFDSIYNNKINDLAQLYQALLQKQQLAAFEVKERFYEIGSFAGIKELEQYLITNREEMR